MPLQNRVDPWGTLSAVPARGTLLGNRGILHNEKKEIIKPYQHQNWVTCRLEFKNRKRKVMSPGTYTELFFLDEATAFAAGHRPCFECRRDRYNEFKTYWVKANLNIPVNEIKITAINKFMHKERVQKRVKVTYQAKIEDLPDGTFFSVEDSAYLLFENKIYPWSFEGYGSACIFNPFEKVDVLTSFSIVKAFKLGFIPEIHHSLKN